MPCYTITYRTEVDLSIDVESAGGDTAVAIAYGRVRIDLCGLLERAGPLEALRAPEPTARERSPDRPGHRIRTAAATARRPVTRTDPDARAEQLYTDLLHRPSAPSWP